MNGRRRRQRDQHPAFRIEPPEWDARARAALEQVLAAVTPAGPESPSSPESVAAQADPADDESLAEAATSLWRAQRRLVQPGEVPSKLTRQTGRYLQRCREALTTAGLTVQEHDGDRFHPGRRLEVLAYHYDPTLPAETVVETVRPSIYFQDRCIQTGQVIVGSAEVAPPAPAAPAQSENRVRT